MKTGSLFIALLLLGTVAAQAGRRSGMSHSPVSVSRTQSNHLNTSNSGNGINSVSPVRVEPIRFNTSGMGPGTSAAGISQSQFNTNSQNNFQHLDFGNRDTNFSNIKMQFDSPNFQHLNVDTTR